MARNIGAGGVGVAVLRAMSCVVVYMATAAFASVVFRRGCKDTGNFVVGFMFVSNYRIDWPKRHTGQRGAFWGDKN